MDHTDAFVEKVMDKLLAKENILVRKQLYARKDRVHAAVRETLDEQGLFLAVKPPAN